MREGKSSWDVELDRERNKGGGEASGLEGKRGGERDFIPLGGWYLKTPQGEGS